MNGFDAGSNLTAIPTTSKLDPNSKPFAPRQPIITNGHAGQMQIREDENKNLIKWINEDKLKNIWTAREAAAVVKNSGPPPPNSKPAKPIATAAEPMNLMAFANEANNNEPNFCLQKASENHTDDFGIRSLLKNVYLSAKSMKSSPETSTVFKDVHEDLGFTAEFRRSFKPSYAYMESPFNDRVVGPISDYNVPDEYIHHLPFKGTLPDPFENMSKMATDLVFFLFYSVPKDKLQIAIAAELYRRGWRYHTEYKIWVARLPNINPEMRHENFEQGEYQYFNKDTWSREKKIIYLEYAKLDNKPSLSNCHGTQKRLGTNDPQRKNLQMRNFHQKNLLE